MTADIIPFPSCNRVRPTDAAVLGRQAWQGEADVANKRKQLEEAIHRAPLGWLFAGDAGVNMQIRNHLRVRFCVNSTNEIPSESLDEAIALVKEMEASTMEFLAAMGEMKNAFSRQVFGGGEPWTPWIRRSLKREIGDRPDWRALAAEVKSRMK